MEFRLETERFILRQMTVDDAEFMFEMNNDPDVVKYTGDAPFDSLEQTQDFMRSYYSRQKPGTGRWGVVEKSNNQMHGWCGIKYESDTGYYDIGYRFVQSSWGRGIATETSKACLVYAFDTLNVERVIGRAMHDNVASINVLEKVGLIYSHEDHCQDHPARLYSIDSQRYLAIYHPR